MKEDMDVGANSLLPNSLGFLALIFSSGSQIVMPYFFGSVNKEAVIDVDNLRLIKC